MNFQKLFAHLIKPREEIFFDEIIGHEHIKRLFGLALRSHEPTHILLSGPPASTKTMFLMSLRQHLTDSYFIDGGNATKAGIKTSVFATCNDPRKLSAALLSRFFIVELDQYTYEQFHEITLRLLSVEQEYARIIADAVWDTSRNLRDCIRIGKLARSEEDVNFLIEKFLRN